MVKHHQEITHETVQQLEHRIDQLTPQIPSIPEFILPGGKATGANLQYARTVARRTERALVKLSLNEQELSDDVLKYINRLSDYLFTLGRYANVLDNYIEIKSKKNVNQIELMDKKKSDDLIWSSTFFSIPQNKIMLVSFLSSRLLS